MGFFSKLFGTFTNYYYIEKDAEEKEFLEYWDVFMQLSENMIYNVQDGHVEVGSEYIKSCKRITKMQFEDIVSGKHTKNPYYNK